MVEGGSNDSGGGMTEEGTTVQGGWTEGGERGTMVEGGVRLEGERREGGKGGG